MKETECKGVKVIPTYGLEGVEEVCENLNLGFEAGNNWTQKSNTYWPGNSSMVSDFIPTGVYRYCQNDMGWFLSLESSGFNFDYKIYDDGRNICARVKCAWKSNHSNLGVLLNGVRGTGKSVSAKLLSNWAIEERMPVILVSQPVPIEIILSSLKQDVAIVFDEFEKTHRKREHQEALLSAIDGVSGGDYRRLFIFTTNNDFIDANFSDRPGRIRYKWTFGRLSKKLACEIIEDKLDPSLSYLAKDIEEYFESRALMSIDIAKSVISEVNIFKESPFEFESFFNVGKKLCYGFTITMITGPWAKDIVLHENFKQYNKKGDEELSRLIANMSKGVGLEELQLEVDGSGLKFSIIGVSDCGRYFKAAGMINVNNTYLENSNCLFGDIKLSTPGRDFSVKRWMERNCEDLDKDEQSERSVFKMDDSMFGPGSSKFVTLKITLNDSIKFSY